MTVTPDGPSVRRDGVGERSAARDYCVFHGEASDEALDFLPRLKP
jgi:hypothetical protein